MSEPRDCTCSAWIKRGEPMRIDSSHCPVHAVRQPASEPASDLRMAQWRLERAALAMTYDPGVNPDSPYLADLREALAALAAARGDTQE